ncbi:MAG: MBL fold metallo-hydrolase [Candidatus Obscuribacterales bacterium]|jgi:glyoxylase-like metal-dependent hydrolase (beta-lactamase superfamily II)|nr:MBL fold metallo-hydrolase [Candidatus Obscuribacterales bacterium]
MLLATFPVGQLQCNCSIIVCPETKEAAVIDPGGDPQEIIDRCEKEGYKIKYLLHTHAHFDHIAGARAVKEKTGAKICLHKEDEWLYNNLNKQGMMFGFRFDEPVPIDHYLQDEEELKVGNVKAKVIFTPGHTPGSSCFSMQEKDSVLFAGDTLFHGSIGRTDLWGGSFEQIIKSIKGRLFELDDSTEVIAGHGPNTSIWNERRENPFVAE